MDPQLDLSGYHYFKLRTENYESELNNANKTYQLHIYYQPLGNTLKSSDRDYYLTSVYVIFETKVEFMVCWLGTEYGHKVPCARIL